MFMTLVESNVLFHMRHESLPLPLFCKLPLFETRFPRFKSKNESYFFEQLRLFSTVLVRKRSNVAKAMYIYIFLCEMGLLK